jgi:hypothetical protein
MQVHVDQARKYRQVSRVDFFPPAGKIQVDRYDNAVFDCYVGRK